MTVNIIRAEMGQHIGTAIARVLADELEVDWSNVRILLVDTDPKWGYMQTGGSKSVWVDFPIYSRAGAAGRIALIEAGARLLGREPVAMRRAPGRRVCRRSIHHLWRNRPARQPGARIYVGPTREAADQAALRTTSHRAKDRRSRCPGEDQRHGALRHRCGR